MQINLSQNSRPTFMADYEERNLRLIKAFFYKTFNEYESHVRNPSKTALEGAICFF